jgi:large subunit ribosomal protein L10
MSNRQEVLDKKGAAVNTLVSDFNASDALFFTEYRGLEVKQLQTLRTKLRKNNAKCVVVKNTLIQRAFSQLSIDCPPDLVKGPTALVISTQDCPTIASTIHTFIKENELMVVKGGFLDGAFISANDVKDLSKLPSREVLLGQLVGGLKSTINRFVMSISSPIRGLVYSLEAIKNKK